MKFGDVANYTFFDVNVTTYVVYGIRLSELFVVGRTGCKITTYSLLEVVARNGQIKKAWQFATLFLFN